MLIKVLRIVLFPFVPLYKLVVTLRNALFSLGLFRIFEVNAKVISVGNLTVGGSGKTPMVVYLTLLLKQRGINVGVLSRGYGRKSKGYLLVSDGQNIKTNVSDSGDEMFFTALECQVPAAVCEDRVTGANRLIHDTGVHAIVLDDAFQHRRIHRDIDIVMFDQSFFTEKTLSNSLMLPTGDLREGMSSVSRAHIVVINRKFSEAKNISHNLPTFAHQKIFNSYYSVTSFTDVKSGTRYAAEDFKNQKVVLLSGIANPDSFRQQVTSLEIVPVGELLFSDHNTYTPEHIQQIRKVFYSTNASSVITTQKDAVKLRDFLTELDDIDLFSLNITMEFDEKEAFEEIVLSKLSYN